MQEQGIKCEPQTKQTFMKKFIVKDFFLQAMSQKVCGEQSSGGEKVKRPQCSTFPTAMSDFSSSKRSERGQGIQSKTQSKQTFFKEIYCQTFFPPSYTSKSVWGEREKASVLHIPYHHVCFHHPSKIRIENPR